MTSSPRHAAISPSPGSPVADVAVLEVEPEGHRLHYLAHLVRAAGPGRCVVLTTDRAVRSEDHALVAPALAEATVVLDDTATPGAALASALAVARERGIPALVVPEGDDYVVPLLRHLVRRPRARTEVRLLLMRTQAVRGPEPFTSVALVKPLLVQLLRLSRRVRLHFLTDALGVVRRRSGYPGVRPVEDPVAPPAPGTPARPGWLPAASPDSVLVGVFGVVTPRKNLPLLVEAVSRTDDAVLVVGGRLAPEVRAFVDADADVAALRAAGRLVVVDRLLDADELAGALAAVDVVAVLHDNDSPSGILAEACVRGTPSLVPTGGWLARVVDATGTGVTTALDPDDVAAALRRVRTGSTALAAAVDAAAGRIGTTRFTDALLGRR
ncbi:hypothetical protein [Blastococcus sp. SYSU D00813]